MLEIKTGEFGADMTGVCQELYDLFPTIEEAWADHGWGTPVITEGRREYDPEQDSLHPFGMAIDIRSHDMSDDDQDELAHDLQVRLGPFYQVVSEHFPNPKDWKKGDEDRRIRDHVHIEMDCAVNPKRAQIKYNYAKKKGENK